ncbi:rod-binding protein [Clostridium formicaceticum]|uniref:Peptidoglycan hydrolase FlgJ n=1 Tax=Clostridium formicaceticum TaxID=1497 RepID=A0AAC9RH17_9CLOT|nr:rod-binding protein [Clostridium formicaceticum]AOY75595.1 hypothetical protein BJL90_06625 [Clostridium formicaceticum]ARE85901.1 Peptidoglycan hydrolase FlgJ [Clostridium formicaceticum]
MKINDHMLQITNPQKIENKNLTEDPKKLMEACKEFEAIFLNMMMQQMRRTVTEDSFIEKSYGREIYEGMQDEEIAKEMARGEGIGLAKQLYQQLSRNIKTSPE